MRKATSFLDGVKVHPDYSAAVARHPVIREAVLAGRISNPKPMNPASQVWRDHNPNIIYINTGAWTMINASGNAEAWRDWIRRQK